MSTSDRTLKYHAIDISQMVDNMVRLPATTDMYAFGRGLKIDANGISIGYDDFGKGAHPIILIHGFPFDKSSWQPQVDFLRKSNRVIAFDIRGFGGSTINGKDLSMDLFADDLIQFMNALNIDKAIVGGLSMGGYIVLNAVNRYPKRFEAIILCDTQCIADSDEEKEKRSRSIHQIGIDGLENFAENFVKKTFCKETLANKKVVVDKIKALILSTSAKTVSRTMTALMERQDMSPTLEAILVPTLIICGTEDTITPLAQSEFLFEEIPDSTLYTIPTAGHLSNLEQPDEFNKHLEIFLAELGVKTKAIEIINT